jgi:hypothetical protein
MKQVAFYPCTLCEVIGHVSVRVYIAHHSRLNCVESRALNHYRVKIVLSQYGEYRREPGRTQKIALILPAPYALIGTSEKMAFHIV